MRTRNLPKEEGKLICRFSPPKIKGKLNMGDTPEEYAVFELPADAKANYGGCIIYGRYGKEWKPNASARALVIHLLKLIDAQSEIVARYRDLC